MTRPFDRLRVAPHKEGRAIPSNVEGRRRRFGDLLQDLLRRHNLDRRVRQRAAVGLWAEVVGADIARNAWALGVREGVLIVGAANHAWAQTLHLMRGSLLPALNARIGEEVLHDLQVRVGRRPAQRGTPREAPRPVGEALPPLTRAEQQRVRQLTAAIEDPELRTRVAAAAAGLMRLRRLREAQGWRPCRSCGRSFLPRSDRGRGRGHDCPACIKRR